MNDFNIIIDFEYLVLMSSKLLNLLKVHINCAVATQILSAFGIDTYYYQIRYFKPLISI